MTQEQNAKYKRLNDRLNDRLNELSQLNGNIARLAFYINENDMPDAMRCTLVEQREAMIKDMLKYKYLI